MYTPRAEELRKAFRAIPKEQRDTHQSFAIRVWRAMSWLERVEQATDIEDRFIRSWIGLNALYGRLDDDRRAWGDHEALGAFLSLVWRLDDEGLIQHVLCSRQLDVLRLIENRFLYDKFWLAPDHDHGHDMHRIVREMMPRFGTQRMLPILQVLLDRLYVMRNQVFHGASTKGSSLNRRTLIQSADLLGRLLPVMITVMIRHGIQEDWGEICFPPVR